MTQSRITAARLREQLTYDEETGVFCWKIQKGWKFPGDVAGYIRQDGYVYIRVDAILYSAHRLAWLYMYGEWPKECVDHINNVKSDNSKKNLRAATNQQNMWNRVAQRNNTSGYKGVGFNKATKKWKATIKCHGVTMQLGEFKTPEEAHKVYSEASARLHGDFSNTGR